MCDAGDNTPGAVVGAGFHLALSTCSAQEIWQLHAGKAVASVCFSPSEEASSVAAGAEISSASLEQLRTYKSRPYPICIKMIVKLSFIAGILKENPLLLFSQS